MRLFKKTPVIPFYRWFKTFGIISAVIVTLSLLLFFVKGLTYGVDFAGGTELQVRIDGATIGQVRQALSEYGKMEIQQFEGKSDEFLIRLPKISLVNDVQIKAYIKDVESKIAGTKLINKHYDSEVGDRIELWFDKGVDQTMLKTVGEKHKLPLAGKIEYKQMGDRYIYRILLVGISNKLISSLTTTLKVAPTLLRLEAVGPKVGKQLRVDAFMSLLYALIAILLYIALRFNYQFSPGAVVALIHDVSITLGIFVLLGITFDLTIVAALLTIVGYSLNDTIVVYDRIRENMDNPNKGANLTMKINTSLNETLNRTLLTSATTIFVLVALLIWGGGIIRGFALAMTIGVVIGTYSSIFIATPVTILLEKYIEKQGHKK
ncbi:protein translocase subunit SecF [bacterium]|nr:protein translocase subunit SecF [bacterium]